VLSIVKRYCFLLHSRAIDAICVHIWLLRCHILRGHIGVPNVEQCQFVMVIYLRISCDQHQLIRDPRSILRSPSPYVAEETLIHLILTRTLIEPYRYRMIKLFIYPSTWFRHLLIVSNTLVAFPTTELPPNQGYRMMLASTIWPAGLPQTHDLSFFEMLHTLHPYLVTLIPLSTSSFAHWIFCSHVHRFPYFP